MNGANAATWKKLTAAFPRMLSGARVEKGLRALAPGEHQPPFICGAFSPDGSMIALSGGGRIPSSPAIWIARVPGFETVAALHGHQGIHGLAWDARTGLLASASNDYCVVLWDVLRGEHLFVCGGDGEPIVKGSVAFGDGVLYVGESEPFEDCSACLLRVDLGSGDVEEVFELGREDDRRPVVDDLVVDAATDSWVFVGSDFDRLDEPFLVRGTGTTFEEDRKLDRRAARVGLHRGEVLLAHEPEGMEGKYTFAFAPDGTRIEASGTEVRTAAWTTKLGATKDVALLVCSPDGRRLVVAGGDVLALLDAEDGKVLATGALPAWFRPSA